MSLKVVLIGSDQFGEQVLQKLLGGAVENVTVVGVAAPENDKLYNAAKEANIEKLFITSTLKNKVDEWKSLDADLGVMAFVTDIIPAEVLNAPKQGSIQYHPSLLPLHRGISSINWAVIKRDSETGYSIFWVDKYLDHGPILLQERFPISNTDTVKSLYFNTLFPKGVDGMLKAIGLVQSGNAPKTPQDQKAATYEPPCRGKFAEIPWHADAADVFAHIRGCNPAPGASTAFGGDGGALKIFDCDLLPELAVGWPGKVTELVPDVGFKVRLNNGTLLVKRVQYKGAGGGKKIGAADFVKEVDLKVGFRFK